MAYQTSQNIQVAVRCRPLNERELKLNSIQVIECREKGKEILAVDKNSPVPTTKTFTFDRVFGVHSKQSEVYNQVVRPVVLEVIEGYNCTIFAYGQTGTGKTFTMEGNSSALLNDDVAGSSSNWDDDPLTGVIPRSVAHLFSILNSISSCEYSVKISFIELYNEELSDLLSESTEKLRIYDDPARKGSVVIPGLEEVVVQNKTEVYRILQKGAEKRQKASTLMNSQSSRSHSIFTVTVFLKEKSLEGEEILKVGKLNLVDLAGSENIERSGATGKRAAEAGKINKSLTTLGRVITALVEHRDHIPYRESNLTRLLQDSLGGKTKTTIIATISPAQCNWDETMSTLDYAHKAKSIRNKPEINQKLVKKALIKEYTEEIDKLKRELWATREKNGVYLPSDLHDSMTSKLESQKEEIRDLLQKISGLNEEMEKINDLFQDTKQNLDEKCKTLSITARNLSLTEANLQQAKQECEESKYIIEEKTKTESVLFQQAQEIHNVNKTADLDCQYLHEKIKRINGVAHKNKTLTEIFSKQITDKLCDMLRQESDMSNDHQENLCSLCEQLADVDTKVNEMKSNVLCELHVFNEQQQEWFIAQGKLLNDEIETKCSTFYETFLARINGSNEYMQTSTNSQLNLCTLHEQLFTTTYTEIQNLIGKIELSHNEFGNVFTERSNQYLTNNKQEIQKSSTEFITNLDKLANSIENVQQDVSSLKTAHQDLQSSVFEAIDSFQSSILKISSQFRQSFQMLDEKCQEIALKNNTNLNELSQIKELVRSKEHESISNQNSEFESMISQPVKQLIQFNSACVKDIHVASKCLKDNYQAGKEKLEQTIDQISTNKKESNNQLNAIVSEQLDQLNQCNKQLQSSIQNQINTSEEFFIEINRDIVGKECDDISSIMKKSLQLTEMTQMSLENLSSNSKDFYQSSINAVNRFYEKDYSEDKVTGGSPPPKVYFNQVDFARTKRNSLLIEEFKSKKASEQAMDTLRVSSDSKSSSRPESPNPLIDAKQENITVPAVQSKRTVTEKENALNDKLSNKNIAKNSKMRKLNPLLEKN